MNLDHIAEQLRPLAIPVADLAQDPANARKHSDKNLQAIADSLRVYGQRKPIVVNRNGMVIEAGNGTLDAARKLGWTQIAAVLVDDDRLTATGYGLVDNRSGELAEWDDAVLARLLVDLREEDVDLGDLGWDDAEVAALLADVAPDPGGEDTGGGEPPADPVSKREEVYELGVHKLMCGDSTSAEDVGRLLDGGSLDILYFDPPYGMALDPRYDSMHSSPDHRKTGDRFAPVIGDSKDYDPAPAMELWSAPEEFWWGADYYRAYLPAGDSWVVWDKRSNDAGMDLDKVIGGSFELCWSKVSHRREIARILWSGHHGMQREDTKSRMHPTQKPTALAEWFFSRWAPKDCLIGDAYLGSGTTLIAAAKTGRRCLGMEISPAYCDVIRKRWGDYARSAGIDPGSGAL